MNQVINADFTNLELRLLAMMADMKANNVSIRSRGAPLSTGRSDVLHAPNATTMRILKERPAGGPIQMNIDTPFIHRVRTGMQ